jgi:hypothetical protein
MESTTLTTCFQRLKLDGCYFGGGTFFYETGGPQDRTLNVRNSIFERTFVALQNTQAGHGNHVTM